MAIQRTGKPRVRMVDVARMAGVSAMTVSRALRQPDRVSFGTRARIQRAIGRAGYVPDLGAAGLASQRTRVIAIIVSTLADSIFADTIAGAADHLRAHDYHLVVGDAGYSADEEERLTAALLGRRPDGLILTGVDHRPRARRLISEAGVPVVECWALTRRPIDSVVGFDNVAAGERMTLHLLDAGYRRVAFAGAPDRRAAQRRQGYERALRARGAGPPIVEEWRGAASQRLHAGGACLGRLMARPAPPDAIFFASDPLAAGALFACQRAGLRVPDDVAIAGLGDFEIAAEVHPALTTVRIPRYEIGRRAAELLLDRVEDRAGPGVVVDLGFEIVARGSS